MKYLAQGCHNLTSIHAKRCDRIARARAWGLAFAVWDAGFRINVRVRFRVRIMLRTKVRAEFTVKLRVSVKVQVTVRVTVMV